MDHPAEAQTQPTRKKSSADRWVKLGFAAAFVAVAGVIISLQLRGTKLGWPGDLDAALAQAGESSPPQRVVVFVRSFPAGHYDKQMVKTTLAKSENIRALKPFVKVELTLDQSAPWAKKYGVTKTPTMLIISADGNRFHKQEGFIGEMEFRLKFLKAPLEMTAASPH